MGDPQVCIGYATTIRTALAVPGAIRIDSDDARAEIEIVEGRCDVVTDGWAELGPYRANGDRLVFDAPALGKYLCEGGVRLTVEPAAGADRRIVSEMLIATALPAMLWSRGEIVLHAAAAVLPGKAAAVAIAGPSGAGKSTILDALAGRDADVVADDSLCLRADGWISGLPASYFLRSDGEGRRLVRPVDADRQRVAARLGALFVIDRPEEGGPGFRRLTGTAALSALLSNRHRPKIPRLLKCEAANLGILATIARDVPVYAWRRRAGMLDLSPEEQAFIGSAGG